jgi:hypothetical protein
LLQVDEPTQLPMRGTILFATGFTGTFYWQSYATEAPRVLTELRAAGFRTVQLKWVQSWWNASPASYEGQAHLACRPASVAQWVHDNLYDPEPGTAFCATGHSDGASQIAYGITEYGLADLYAIAILDGGPGWTRLDLACIPDDPTYQSLWLTPSGRSIIDWGFGFFNSDGPCSHQDVTFRDGFQEASIAAVNYDYVYPTTTLAFLIGEFDTTTTALQARVYHDRLVQAGSPFVTLDIIPGGAHGACDTTQGADLLRDTFIADCHP